MRRKGKSKAIGFVTIGKGGVGMSHSAVSNIKRSVIVGVNRTSCEI